MVCVGRELRDHLVPAPLSLAETPSTRLHCSKPFTLLKTHLQSYAFADFHTGYIALFS